MIAQEARLILENTKLFTHLSTQDIDEVFTQASTVVYQPGDLILREGDIGDVLYIILSGAVRVFTHNKEGKELVLARLEKGNYFGEQALLSAKPVRRNANVIALSEVTVITISHKLVQDFLPSNKQLLELLKEYGKQQLITKLIKQLEIQESEQKEMFSLFNKVTSYSKREVFFRQGDLAKNIYYVLIGSVELRLYDLVNDKPFFKSRAVIHAGQFFGKESLVEASKYNSTAVALQDTQVAVIDALLFNEAQKKNDRLQNLFSQTISFYHNPSFGNLIQYEGNFLGYPAVQTNIQKTNGEVLITSRVKGLDIIGMVYADCHATQSEYFQDENRSRELKIVNNRLVGIISTGNWDDIEQIFQPLYEKIAITPQFLQSFTKTGKITLAAEENLLCICMQIKYSDVQKVILEGVSSVDIVATKTGAGTICGGCRPKIIELLGGEAWTPVKITCIRKHNESVNSFQFQPIDKSINPYQAGQHIVIEANIEGQWIARSYTLTSIYEQNNQYYEITVKREKLGLFSSWLFENARPGVILRVSDPQGPFTINPKESTPLICFMAGIGVTPAIAFIKNIISYKQQRKVYVHYSIRQSEDIIFQEEISNWPKHFANISITLYLTSQKGHLTEVEINKVCNLYPEADIYICGPDSYQQFLVQILKKICIPENKIHLETFTHAGGPINLQIKEHRNERSA